MNSNQEERIKNLLRQALAPVESGERDCDLWPRMLDRIQAAPLAVPWFDWALLGGLAALLLIFPASIPVLLYYL